MIVDPCFEQLLDHTEVNDPSDRIGFCARHKNLGCVVVPMQILALSTVIQQTVASAEFDLLHYRDAH
jgi:hypothetical protein